MSAPDPFAGVRARNLLVARVRAELRGLGLDVRDRENALVITRPGDPDGRRVYVTYATGEVSLYQPVWRYLGHLDDPGRVRDPDADPLVDAAAIVAALTDPRDPAGKVEGTSP